MDLVPKFKENESSLGNILYTFSISQIPQISIQLGTCSIIKWLANAKPYITNSSSLAILPKAYFPKSAT